MPRWRPGSYPDVYAASAAMGKVEHAVYVPDEGRAAAYDRLYDVYTELHDDFGRGDTRALHTLRRVRNAATESVLGGDGPNDAAPETDGPRSCATAGRGAAPVVIHLVRTL